MQMHSTVKIDDVELTSDEVTVLRAVVDLAVDTLDKAPSGFTSDLHRRGLRRIQGLLANGE